MNRLSRRAAAPLAAALTAVVALGVASPAAVAAPAAAHAKVVHKADHAKRSAHGHGHKTGHEVKAGHGRKARRAGKADRALTSLQRRLGREATRKSAFLGRVAGSRKVQRLDETVRVPLLLNISGDRTRLDDLGAVVPTASASQLRTVAAELRAVRPERYRTIVHLLRVATALRSPAAALPEAADLQAVIDAVVTYAAETSRADLRAAQRTLSRVKEAVEAAEDGAEDGAEVGETEDETGHTEPLDPGEVTNP